MTKQKPYHNLVLHVSRSTLDKHWVYQVVADRNVGVIELWLWFYLGNKLLKNRSHYEKLRIIPYCLADETCKTIGSWQLYDAKLAAEWVVKRIFKHYNSHKKGGLK